MGGEWNNQFQGVNVGLRHILKNIRGGVEHGFYKSQLPPCFGFTKVANVGEPLNSPQTKPMNVFQMLQIQQMVKFDK